MVDCVISSREIYDDYAGDFPCFRAIFDMPGAIFVGAETSLFGIRTCSIMETCGSASGARTVCRGDTKGNLV